MSSLLLTALRLTDPATQFDSISDLLLVDGKISAIGKDAKSKARKDCETFDAKGLVVCPGLIDLHAHLREPGQSAKETIATGTLAAARGGFTSVVCMPNTSPSIDNPATVVLVREKAEKSALINVYSSGAITQGIAREELAPIGSLTNAESGR